MTTHQIHDAIQICPTDDPLAILRIMEQMNAKIAEVEARLEKVDRTSRRAANVASCLANPDSVRLFCLKLDRALRNRQGAKVDDYADVHCEVCGDHIARYIGPNPGVICTTCLEISGEGACTRIMPLAITRSSIQDDKNS